MAVEAVASVVTQKLTDMLREESIIGQKLIVEQLQEIKENLKKMRGYLIDAENKRDGDETIKNWADAYLKNLYYVEDTIEKFAFRIARQRKMLGFLMNHALFLKNFTACRMLNIKMKKIRAKIKNSKKPSGVDDASVNSKLSEHNVEQRSVDDSDDVVSDDCGVTEETEDVNSDLPEKVKMKSASTSMRSRSIIKERLMLDTKLRSSFSYDENDLGIVGFKEQVHSLIEELTKEGHGDVQVISIFGVLGSGKTTLTQAILATKRIKERFKSCCARVTIFKDSTVEEILLKLLKQLGCKDQDRNNPKDRLRECLNEKRYLIVLDDVDVCTSDVWESLKDVFPENKHGSKIIITTSCHENVSYWGNTTFKLEPLTDEESWELFQRKAAADGQVADNIKKRIQDICEGMPLKVILLGSLLSTKKVDQWEETLSRQQDWTTLDIIALSYNDLPGNLKLCMLYMVIFPIEYDIPVRRLLRLWLAEGFVKRPDKEGVFPEDEAQLYFDNLFKRSLIQISKQRSDGNHNKKCRLLGVLHHYLSSKANDINLFRIHGLEHKISTDVRRLVEYVHIKNSPPDSEKLRCVRSFLLFNCQKKDISVKGVHGTLRKMISTGFRLLRVLDLEGVYKPCLPENLGDFFHLRYLGLRWTFLDTLPSSVGELTYLETLDLKHTYVNSLPNSIWKLKHLRHLNLNGMRLDLPESPPSTFPRLLTLWGLSIVENRECILKYGLKKLESLRELGITFHLSNCEDLFNWVSNLTTLQQLRLRSKDDTGRPSKLGFKSLAKLIKLSNMNLLGYLPKLPDINEFPQKIKVLSLSVSELKEDPMPTLEQLKRLIVLRLLADSYLGQKIVCRKGGFKELRVLKLWMLRNLEDWELEEGAMQKLQELNIRCCDKLKKIPTILMKQNTFKELELTNMPTQIIEDVMLSKSMHVSVIVKEYTFT